MKYTLGIDIGGTKITGVLFDGKKTIRELTVVTPADKKDFIYSLRHLAAFLSAGKKVGRIGIGCAGFIDPEKKAVIYSPNIPYLKKFQFSKVFGRHQLMVDNDANCFIRAEWRLGGARGAENAVGLILGTGVGMGMVIGRRAYRGSNGAGGEIGHSILDFKSSKTAEAIFKDAKKSGQDKRVPIVTGTLLANIINILDPDCVIIGGGVALSKGNKLLDDALPVTKKFLFNKNAKPKVLISKLKNAGAIGAALLWK